MQACVNFEWDAKTGKNLFWLSVEGDIYARGPFASVAAALEDARASGWDCDAVDADTRAADRENGNK